MKVKNLCLYLCKMCVAASLMVTVMFITPSAPIVDAESAASEFQISYGGGSSPRMDGNHVIWLRNSDIYLYSVTQKKETQITSGSKSSGPSIQGDLVVWADSRNGYTDIYMYEISKGKETRITNTDSSSEMTPFVYGDVIVYKLGTNIYKHEISKGTATNINNGSDTGYSETTYAIHGDKIVWYDFSYSSTPNSAIYMYDLTKGEKTTVMSGDYKKNPAIYGANIIWEDKQKKTQSETDIYLYNLDTQQGKFIGSGTTNQYQPAIGEQYAVWIDVKDGVNQIVSYDLISETTTQLTTSSASKYLPSVFGDTVIWQIGVNTGTNKDIGLTIMEVVNNTVGNDNMQKVLLFQELGLSKGSYSDWKANDKVAVAADVLAGRPNGGYADKAAVQTAFDAALAKRKPVADVNSSRTVATMKVTLENTSLGLELQAYKELSAGDQDAVVHTVLSKLPPGNTGFIDVNVIQTALDEAIQKWIVSSWRNLGAQDMNGWFTSMTVYQGTPYVAYQDYDHANKASVKKFDGTNWVVVGSHGLSGGRTSTYMCIAVDSTGNPYLAYWDEVLDKITVKKFDGTSWKTVGSEGFSDTSPFYISLTFDKDNVPYVAYREPGKGIVKKFNGTAWETVGGNKVAESDASFTKIVFDSNNIPYVAYADAANESKATVVKLDGGNWIPVGSKAFSKGSINDLSLALNSKDVPYVVYRDTSNSSLTEVMKFDGTNWVLVGSDISEIYSSSQTIAIDKDIPYIAYANGANESKAIVKKFDGTNWVTVGDADFTDGAVEYLTLAIHDNTAYLGFLDRFNYLNRTLVMKGDLTTNALTYTIEAIADQTPVALKAGYAAGTQETKTVTIKRTGTGDLTNLAVTLSGPNANDFTITQPAATTLNTGTPSTTFTVKTRDGLTAGTYTAAVTVSAGSMTAVTFTVTQVVNNSVLKGDVNKDGQVTPADALYITKFVAGKMELTEEQKLILDMNDDNVVNAEDMKIIMSIYLGGGVG